VIVKGLKLLLGIVFVATRVHGADIVWTNVAGGNWSAAANWSPNQVPGTGDNAIINAAGTYTVTINANTIVGSLQMNASSGTQTLSIASGTLTLNEASALNSRSVLNLNSATLTGTGDITIGGVLNWGSGTMSGSGRTIIASGGSMNLNNSTHDLNRTVQNDGTATWTAGALQMNAGSFINNGSFTVSSGSGLSCYGTGGVNAFVNAGTFTKQGGGSAILFTSTTGVTFGNNGVVDVQAGTLTFSAGGTNSSAITVAEGASLTIGGTYSHTITSSVAGSGTFNVSGTSQTFAAGVQIAVEQFNLTSGTASFAGNVSFKNLHLVSGTLTGAGDVTVTELLHWESGIMSGSGRTLVANGATLTLNNTTHDLNRALQNDGTATWTAGALQMNGGTFINNGSFTVSSGSGMSCYGTGGVNVFTNAGTFTKQGAGNMNFFTSTSAVTFGNNGVVDVQAGTLTISAGGTNSSAITVAEGAAFTVSGNYSHTTSSSVAGPGIFNLPGGSQTFAAGAEIAVEEFNLSGATASFAGNLGFNTFRFLSGTLTGAGDVIVTNLLHWESGTMGGSGRTVVANGGTLTLNNTTHDLNRLLQNDGIGTWTAGALQMNGGTFTNKGTFTVNSGATLSSYGTGGVNRFDNTGTFIKEGNGLAQFFVSTSAVTFNNSGTVQVQGGTLGLDAGGGHSGDFAVAASGTARFGGTHALAASSQTTGAGNLLVNNGSFTDAGPVSVGSATFSGGTATFNDSFTGGSLLTVNGGTVNFNGATSLAADVTVNLSSGVMGGSGDVTIGGALNWSGGAMAGTGSTIVGPSAILTLNNTTHDLNRRLENNGTATWTAGALQMNGGTFVNNGSFTANSSSSLSCYGTGGVNAFNNAGTFTKQGTGTTSLFVSSSGVPFNNSGTLNIPNGTLTFNAGFTQTAGQTMLSGGSLSANSALQFQGGLLSGTGTIAGSVSNSGTVSPGASPGTLTITGNYTQGESGVLNIELAGTVAGTGFDRLAVGGTANLAGTLNVVLLDGFTPATSASFIFLNCANRSGSFSTFNFPAATASLQLTYSSTSATIQESTIPFTPTVFWVGASGDWNTATNWNTGVVPGINDDILINVQGDVVITHSSGSHISRSLFSQNAIVLSGGSLTISNTVQVNNGLTLSGGTLRSATVLPGTGGQGIVATGTGGTLDGVTLNGEMDIGRLHSGASVNVVNGLIVNGTVFLGNPSNNWWGQIGFAGTQTVGGNGTIIFGNQGACNALRLITGGTTLTIGPDLLLRGHSGQIGQSTSCIGSPANVSVINQGTIVADVAGGMIATRGEEFINEGTLAAENGGHLNIQNLVGNLGDVALITGSTLTLNGSYTNDLKLDLSTNAVLSLNGTWINAGGINTTNATLNLGGNFDLPALGDINRTAGRVNLTGTLDAAGGTLTLNEVSGSWWMNGGTLLNAVLNEADGAMLIFDTGTLDGVTVNGDLDVGRQHNGAVLFARNGLVLNGTVYLGNPTNSWWGQMGFVGTQTLSGNGTVVFGNQGFCNAVRVDTAGTTLTLGPGITVRGQNGQIGQSTSCIGTPANVTVINQGAISADINGGTIRTQGEQFQNQGVLDSRNGGHLNIQNLAGNAGEVVVGGSSTLSLNGSYTNNLALNLTTNAVLNLAGNWFNTGSINATNATVNLGGNFNFADLGDLNRVNGTVNLTGTLNASGGTIQLNAETGSWVMLGGTLRNAILSTSGGAQLIFGAGTLDGVTVNGDLDVGRAENGAVMHVVNGLVLNGTLYLGHPSNSWWGQVAFVGSQNLSGNGTVLFGNQGFCNALRIETAATTLNIGPGITIRGHSGQIGQSTSCVGSPANVSVVNEGLISAETSGGSISIRAQSFTNNAVAQAVSGGALIIDRLLNSATGEVLAENGGVTLNGGWSNAGVVFVTNSTLTLGGSSTLIGEFAALNSTLNVAGTFTSAQMEAIEYSPGRVRVSSSGIILNTDHTLVLNSATGSWAINGGTVRNGSVSTSGGAQLVFGSGTLDGVTVNGDLDIGRQDNGANVSVVNGLTLNGTAYLGNPTNNWWGQLAFVGTQTLNGTGSIVFGNQGACNAVRVETGGSILTIGPGVTIRGHSGQIGQSTSCIGSPANVTVINEGTIASEVSAGTIWLRAQNFENRGLIDARSGTISFLGGYTLADGTLTVGITSQSTVGRITFNSQLVMDGELGAHFNGAYRPASGTSFTLLTYPSRTGSFDLLTLPADVQWQTSVGATEFAITGTGLLELPSIVTGPQTQSIVVGSPANFSVSALGTQPLGFQWQRNGTNLANSSRISGSQTDSLAISQVLPEDAGAYRVIVTNAFGSATSLAANLTPLCIVAASNNPADAGNIVGIGVFAAGQTNKLTATPRPGYKFSNWTEGAVVISTSPSLTTVLLTNHVFVANYTEANPLHTVTTATLPAGLVSLGGAGTYSNGQSFAFSAPASITNPPNLYVFNEWRANGALVSSTADFTKTFSTFDPTNIQFVAHYDTLTILPLVTNVTINMAQPVPATTNFQLSVQFNRTMDTNFIPQIALSNSAPGSVQPTVATGGRWTTVAATNDTYTPPAITLGSGMNGDHFVVVSGARDLSGSELTGTNVLIVRVDVTPPSAPLLTLVSSNSSSATVSWSAYAAPADVASFRIYLAQTNFTSVTGRVPISGTGAGTRQFTFNGLELDRQYFAAVSAVDIAGNSSQTVTPLAFSLPSSTPPPVALAVQASGTSSANLSWAGYNTTQLLGFAGFNLYYETTNFTSVSNLTPKQSFGPGVRSAQLNDLDRTRIYYFAVVGFNGNGGLNPNVTSAMWSDPLAGDIAANMTIGGSGQVVDIFNDIHLVNNAVLTIAPGTTVRFAADTSLTVAQGAIHANGTALDPIIFTSQNDPSNGPAPGDWDGIVLGAGAGASVLRHVFVNYGADLTISNCTATIEAFTAYYNIGAGLNLLGTASLGTADALLAFNGLGARQFDSAQLTIRNSVLKNNGTNAQAAGSSSLIATQNWWGSTVAADIGASVRGAVTHSGFLTHEPLLTPAVGTSNNITQTGSRLLDLRLACRTAEAMRLSEDSTFAGVFFTPFTNRTVFQLSEGGGAKTVFAQFRSITGQTSAPVSLTVNYITAGPTIGSFSLTEGQVLNRPLLVTGSASAPLGMSTMEFYVDNIAHATNLGGGFSYPFDLRNLSAGVHRVKLLARDNVGNFATLERNIIVSPTPPPAPNITDPAADIALGTNQVRIAGTAEPFVEIRLFRAGAILGVTNASAAGTFSFTAVPLVEGVNEFIAVAADPLGNASSPVRTITRDTVPPAALILDSPVYTYGTGLTLTWRFSPTGKRATAFQIFWHTAPITSTNQASGHSIRSIGSQLTVQGLATANYYFYVVGFDNIGNSSPLSAPVQFLFDAVPPAFTIGFDKTSPVGSGPLRITLTSSEPINGTPSATIKLSGAAPALLPLTNSAINTFEGLINVNPLMRSGPVSFNLSAADLAGNPFNGSPSGPDLVIDLTPPSAVISTTPGAPVQATNNTAVAVNLRLTEQPKSGTVPTVNFAPPLGENVSLALTGEGTNWNGTLTVTPEMGSGVGHFTLTVNDDLDNVGHNIIEGSSLEIYNTGLPTPPAQPVGFQATSLSGGRVRLNWLAVSNAEIYRVYSAAGTNLTTPTTLVADNISTNTYIDLPAADGNYRYVVTASRRGSEGTNSIVRVAESDRTPPPAPTNVAVQLVAAGLRVTWQSVAGETPDHFSLYRNGTLIRTVGSGVTSINDTPPRGVMNYTVAAADDLGNEATSAPATIELLVGAVDNLQALVVLGSAPKLTWSSSDPSAVAFNVYRNGIKQNAAPLASMSFTDALAANGEIVTYAVRALNSTNAESAARTVDVHTVDLRLSVNETGGTARPPTGRYFDKYHVTVANLTAAGAMPLRQLEVRRTSTAGPLNLVETIGTAVNSGTSLVRDISVPCAADTSAQTVRLRAIQETDVGGSSVIYEASFAFPTIEAPGVMMEVSANAQPLAGGLNSFDVRVHNRGYATMYLATTRGNGSDPGDLSIIVRNAQGQEVSRQPFTGSPAGIIFAGGVGYVAIEPGASKLLTVPGVLVPEALASEIVTFEAVAESIYDRFSATGQQRSGPLIGSMQSSLAQTPYYGTAQTDSSVYSNDQPILVSGQALDRATGTPKANVPLKIGFATRGYRWYRDVTTDAAGTYSYTYNPGPGLAGSLTIWAAHPEVVDQLNQARVTIYRLYPTPASGDIRMSKNDTLDFSIMLFNPGDQPLTGFTVSAQLFEVQGTNRTVTTKVAGSLLSDTNLSVAPGQRQTVNLRLAAADDAPNNAIAVFTFTSTEGASAEFTANVSLLPAVPVITVLSPEVGYVDVSVDRGNLLSRSVTIANRGLKDLLGVTLARPTNETWMVLNLPPNPDGSISLPDLRVGESNTFTVVFAPSTNITLGFHQDKIVVRGTNSTATFDVNLFARVTSDQFGAVQFYVDNILGADVPNATVRLRNTTLQVELPPVYTDIGGLVTITNLQEGDWSWQVNAPGHSANVGVVQVVPSQTVQVATRLNKSVVTINFSVVPVPFTDRYEIKLEQTFETHVPVPVLVMSPTYMQFDNVKPGFEATYIVTAKNEGLIQMENLTIKGSQSASATFTPLITYVPILLPQQTVEIPMHVTYSGVQGQSQQGNPLSDCLPNPLGFMDDIGPFTEGLAALANAEGRCIKDNTLLMCAGAVAMGMKIFGDVTGVLASVAEQAASYIGCVIGSLLSNLGSGIAGGGGGGGGSQQAVQNFTQGGPICFAADTQVLLADGHTKSISEIKTGDLVKTGSNSNNVAHVTEVFALASDRIRDLHFTWPRAGRSNSVRTTDEHLFWVDGKGWVEAKKLKVGDWLLDEGARPVQITENRRYAGTLPVYTFRLREDSAFYANGVLVHDMCGVITPGAAIADSPPDAPGALTVFAKEGASK
jgi:hypothetical protein